MLACSAWFFYEETLEETNGLDADKKYSKKLFYTITGLAVFAAAGISAGLYFGIENYLAFFPADGSQEEVSKLMNQVTHQVQLAQEAFFTLILPATVLAVLLLGWGTWLILKIVLSGAAASSDQEDARSAPSREKKKDFVDQKIEQERKQRIYLHVLSLCQREGRLLDFFSEDLNEYDDDQIGAAVRSIQEDCKKVIEKYISPKPVIDKTEGDVVEVEKGFDIDAITLVGNVAGEPPFKGVLNHRGWKAGKRDIPKLSDIQDSGIITPAEVEIQ